MDIRGDFNVCLRPQCQKFLRTIFKQDYFFVLTRLSKGVLWLGSGPEVWPTFEWISNKDCLFKTFFLCWSRTKTEKKIQSSFCLSCHSPATTSRNVLIIDHLNLLVSAANLLSRLRLASPRRRDYTLHIIRQVQVGDRKVHPKKMSRK